MEMTSECTLTKAKQILEWPEVPHLIIKGVGNDIDLTPIRKQDIQTTRTDESTQEPQPIVPEPESIDDTLIKQSVAKHSVDLTGENNIGPKDAEGQSKPTIKAFQTDRQRSYFKRLLSSKYAWPNPELSIGARCNRLGDRECWQAIGPAGELFDQIAEAINHLLDIRLEDIQKGEPLADNIISYGM